MKEATVKYCVGCGLCQSYGKASLVQDEKGFSHPECGDQRWLDDVCPIGNLPREYYDESHIWGRREAIYYGWSNRDNLRQRASSGGAISEIAIYLLDNKVVDGVVHICADPNDPTKTISSVSKSAEEVVKKCGSRYAISSPLDILYTLDSSQKYAIIGKPCDIIALRNYQTKRHQEEKSSYIYLSFFCMGLPSIVAQEKLLNALGSNKTSCRSLSYRGNGWPGFATAINMDGTIHQIDYESSWGKILGRDLMTACRFCMDGIGEAADISCGDAWYIGQNGKPDFSEKEGRNIVIARSKRGLQLLKDINKNGHLTLEPMDAPDNYLSIIQKSQLYRRASMGSRVLALRLLRKPYPKYSKRMLWLFSRHISYKDQIKVFFGTCKRVLRGAI